MSVSVLDPKRYYRLPWSLNDNVLVWLEPTKRCNIYCEGCYSRNEKKYDKSVEQIRADLRVFAKSRRFDSVSITGGDPLMHDDIVGIVRMIKNEFGYKPILNTNAYALTPEIVRDLKKAGVFGFTFHIDSGQSRPKGGWTGKNDLELCELRLKYAQMVADEGGMSVAFNSTVYPHTLEHVPGMLKWAREHIDIVHSMVFILFRTTRTVDFDYFAQGKPVDPKELIYYDESKLPTPLTASDIVSKIKESDPDFEPCAYLGGTKDPQSLKWLLTLRVGDKNGVKAYMGPKFMEIMQAGHHALTGRYFAYSNPAMLSMGRSLLAGGWLLDPSLRSGALSWAKELATAPWKIAQKQHFQSIAIIQPIDFMADGETNMCDGCPDMTVHNGELVWSCRLDERLQYGCFLTAAPRHAAAVSEPVPSEPKAAE
ncbi:MAG: radical SAM protein [Polyangiaceae bacterium]|nr:radical SAM protein [Polyangiaceae bacterium]